MRVKNITQRFQAFVQNLQESFWGDFQGQMRRRLKEMLEKDAEPQMTEYLGLKWHERGKAADRLSFRFHWRSRYPAMVRQLERDRPELLHFFALRYICGGNCARRM